MNDPKKINNFILFDLETGGLSWDKNPVMEFAGMVMDGVTLEEKVRYDNLVQPYDDSLTYQQQAMDVNGLSVKMCQEEGIPLKQLVNDICELFEEAKNGSKFLKPILVAHNGGFDKPFLQDMFLRCGKDLSKYVAGSKDRWGNFQPHMIDTVDDARQIWAEVADSSFDAKMRSCCDRAGIDLSGSHRAITDVIGMAELFRFYINRKRNGGQTIASSVENDGSIDGVIDQRRSFQW